MRPNHERARLDSFHRLQRDGFIERMEHSYAISEKGQSTILPSKKSGEQIELRDQESVTLLQSVLPSDLNQQLLIDSMSYKWFGNLRWFGSASKDGMTILSWITSETGLTISAKIRANLLTIETYPRDSSSISEATRSAFELFDHVSRTLKSSDRTSLLHGSTAS